MGDDVYLSYCKTDMSQSAIMAAHETFDLQQAAGKEYKKGHSRWSGLFYTQCNWILTDKHARVTDDLIKVTGDFAGSGIGDKFPLGRAELQSRK